MDNGIYNIFGDQIGSYDASGNAVYDNANTGDNGSGGAIPNLTNLLSTGGNLATSILSTLGLQKTAQANANAARTQAQSNALISNNTTKMLIIGGLILAVVVVVVMIFRRGK